MRRLFFVLISVLFLSSCGSDGDENNKQDVTIFPGIGLTNVSLGDTGYELVERCGTPAIDSVNFVGPGITYILFYLVNGQVMRLEPKLEGEDYLTKKVEHISVLGRSEARTESGIGLGSTTEEVIAAFGEPISTSPYYAYSGIEFSISQDTVGAIYIE